MRQSCLVTLNVYMCETFIQWICFFKHLKLSVLCCHIKVSKEIPCIKNDVWLHCFGSVLVSCFWKSGINFLQLTSDVEVKYMKPFLNGYFRQTCQMHPKYLTWNGRRSMRSEIKGVGGVGVGMVHASVCVCAWVCWDGASGGETHFAPSNSASSPPHMAVI